MKNEQRIAARAVSRRGAEAQAIADYLAQALRDEGATIVTARGVPLKRGGGVQVIADAPDALAVVGVLRAKLDADVNAYARESINELRIAAFKTDGGGMLGFVTENYAVAREGGRT